VAKVFIVEDDQDLNAAYRMILTKEGYGVETAFNGEEALARVESFGPDLILLDLLMPVKSGIEFLQEYDVMNRHRDVKVLIFTNLEHASEIHEAFRLGADQCIIKAWTAPQGLVKIVSDVLGSQDNTGQSGFRQPSTDKATVAHTTQARAAQLSGRPASRKGSRSRS
jgi:DNA-binding response OmpR family regulator